MHKEGIRQARETINTYRLLKKRDAAEMAEDDNGILWTRILAGISAGLWFILLILKFI